MNRKSSEGMALVITLIMLSVTLIMAIAFLAISRRERISVSSSHDSTVARFASDTALAAAESQILGNIFTTNATLYDYSLIVSTNYLNPFFSAPAATYNVGYTYADGTLLNQNDFLSVLTNLLILPRAPVMITGAEPLGRYYLDLNRNGVFEDSGDNVPNAIMQTGPVNVNAVVGTVFTNGTFSETGDPQWVGILERAGQAHSADNKFVSRYAFIALPVGESLDLNAIHNQAMTERVNQNNGSLPAGVGDGFVRNQGVGAWELNLAAFLADLNTNQWDNINFPFVYNRPLPGSFANTGVAFDDARALLSYRYNFLYGNLAAVYGAPGNRLFGNNTFFSDNIDEYCAVPALLQLVTTNIVELNPFNDPVTQPWAGADNPNHFYTPSDFFQTNRTLATSMANRLLNAGTTAAADGAHPTYDRYTFYRMLDQLGTDTLPDSVGKLNLNWQNAIVNYNAGLFVGATVVPGMETNLIGWNPRDFFCAAADQMLKVYTTNWFQTGPSNYLVTYYGIHYTLPIDRYTGFGLTNIPYFGLTNQVPAFGLTNIPVQVNGNFVYSPAVNRVLQLAANIYDAGTNDFYPHVFRPTFLVRNELDLNNVSFKNTYINGFDEVSSLTGLSSATIGTAPLDAPVDLPVLPLGITSGLNTLRGNVYGVPWIIGAKKFMPNFNQFYAFNTAQVTRKLQFNRTAATVAQGWSGNNKQLYSTNQMINLSITNHIGFSFWNSYTADYPGQPYVYAQDFISMRLSYGSFSYTLFTNFSFASNPLPWHGSAWSAAQPPRILNDSRSFIAGLFEFPFVHEASLDLDQNGNLQGTGFKTETFVGAPTTLPSFPAFEEDTTNRFQAVILENGHILDYVQFYGPVSVRNLGDDVSDPNVLSPSTAMWATNLNGAGVNWGVLNQVAASINGGAGLPASAWQDPPNMPAGLQGNKTAEGKMFQGFFAPSWNYVPPGTPPGTPVKTYFNTNLVQQAPYTPTRTVVSPTVWVVNDPLVHNLSSDLTQPVAEVKNVTNGVAKSDNPSVAPVPYPSLGAVPDRYQPWGRNNQMEGVVGVLHDNPDNASYHLGYKDPLAWGSDNWDFPTNKYPSVGWLGRVHRGTPWQTVYLKATNLLQYINPAQANQNVGLTTWENWTGDFGDFDAGNSKPIQDEVLFDIFTAAPNANASRGTLSVNQKHPAAWSAVLSGLVVITNITSSPQYSSPPVYTNVISDPAGVDLLDSPLWQIVNGANGINAMRANLYPGAGFLRAGDILRVPLLSEQSPFLNRADAATSNDRINFDLSDEAYEWLPEQIMGLVRSTGLPRYVIYSYGQTLKPDPNGTMLSGGFFFGVVTNYQVVAESATRAVVTVVPTITNSVVNGVVGPATNYNIKVESFNVLPPD